MGRSRGQNTPSICNSIVIDETDGLTFLGEVFEVVFLKIGIDWRTNDSLREHHEAFFDSSRSPCARGFGSDR